MSKASQWVAGWWLGLAQRVYGRDRLVSEQDCLCCRTPEEIPPDVRARIAAWMLGLRQF